MKPSGSEFQLVARVDGVSRYVWRDVVVMHQHGEYTLEAARMSNAEASRVRRLAGTDAPRTLLIVEPDAPPPNDAVRAELVQVMGSDNAQGPMAIVALAEGFRTAFVSGILTNLKLNARTSSPMRTFASLTDACVWLTTLAPDKGTAAELEHVASTIRQLPASR